MTAKPKAEAAPKAAATKAKATAKPKAEAPPKASAKTGTAKPKAEAPPKASAKTGTAKPAAKRAAAKAPEAKPAPKRATSKAAAPKPTTKAAKAAPKAKAPSKANSEAKPATPRISRTRSKRREKLPPDRLEILVEAARKSLEDDKAENILVLDVTGRADYTDRLIIATGQVERQLQAMASHLDEALGKAGLHLRRDAIQASPDWVLIDAGDLVIHLFRPDARELYRLERMWGPESPSVTENSDAARE